MFKETMYFEDFRNSFLKELTALKKDANGCEDSISKFYCLLAESALNAIKTKGKKKFDFLPDFEKNTKSLKKNFTPKDGCKSAIEKIEFLLEFYEDRAKNGEQWETIEIVILNVLMTIFAALKNGHLTSGLAKTVFEQANATES